MSHFTYTANSGGYMLAYKGVSLGGAGLLCPEKTPKRRRAANCKMFAESAAREIRQLEAFEGNSCYRAAIRKIDLVRSAELLEVAKI